MPRAKQTRKPKPAGAVQTEADDLRPMIKGSKVCIPGALRDGPPGEVVEVKGDIRSVLFEGEEKVHDVPLEMLRRLP